MHVQHGPSYNIHKNIHLLRDEESVNNRKKVHPYVFSAIMQCLLISVVTYALFYLQWRSRYPQEF